MSQSFSKFVEDDTLDTAKALASAYPEGTTEALIDTMSEEDRNHLETIADEVEDNLRELHKKDKIQYMRENTDELDIEEVPNDERNEAIFASAILNEKYNVGDEIIVHGEFNGGLPVSYTVTDEVLEDGRTKLVRTNVQGALNVTPEKLARMRAYYAMKKRTMATKPDAKKVKAHRRAKARKSKADRKKNRK